MENSINYIKVNDDLMVDVNHYRTVFRLKNLPDKVHFTIAYNETSPDVNFHISKNIKNNESKPKIEIVRISKKTLLEDQQGLALKLLNLFLEEVNTAKIRRRYKKVWFFPFDELENYETKQFIEEKLKDNFKSISRVERRKRLKIKGDVLDKFKMFSQDVDIQNFIIGNLIPFNAKVRVNHQGGMLCFGRKAIGIIKINKKWFKIRQDVNLFEMLSYFIDKNYLQELIPQIKRAIIRVKNAKDYSDTKPYNNPVQLVRQSLQTS